MALVHATYGAVCIELVFRDYRYFPEGEWDPLFSGMEFFLFDWPVMLLVEPLKPFGASDSSNNIFEYIVIECNFPDFGKCSLVRVRVLYNPDGCERISSICYRICSGKGLVEPKELESSCISGNLDLCNPNPWISSAALDADSFGDNRGGEVSLVAFDSVGP